MMKGSRRSILLLLIPLILSAFTHLWNPLGYPAIHTDEGHYMRRAIHVLDGLGPEDLESGVARNYDHPYFGQLFLASVFRMNGYPESLNPSPGNEHSIQMLYFVPRIILGLLAVVDTFLIYKIAERRYNRNVAFIAAILFAVMPMTWISRIILLDSLALPLILLSILFAIYSKTGTTITDNKVDGLREPNTVNLLLMLSGIFLGLAIFTKLLAAVMIPLISFLIWENIKTSRNIGNANKLAVLKQMGFWFIPMILIFGIWPGYAILIGQAEDWLDGFLYQAGRTSRPLIDTIAILVEIDPFLLLFGLSGVIFSAIKRDYFLAIWSIPFLLFLLLIDYASYWYFTILIPALSISSSNLLLYVFQKMKFNRRIQMISLYAVISVIVIFGLVTTSLLITTNITKHYFETVTFISQFLPGSSSEPVNHNNQIVLVGNRWLPGFSWILDQIFNNNLQYEMHYKLEPIKNERVFLIVDKDFSDYLSNTEAGKNNTAAWSLYNQSRFLTNVIDKTPSYPRDTFPYTSMVLNNPLRSIELRSNY